MVLDLSLLPAPSPLFIRTTFARTHGMITESMTQTETETESQTIRLNLGAGATTIDGFKPVDASIGDSVYPLDYADESVDEIYASHILEHFGHEMTRKVLSDWVRTLKPGGKIRLAVPNFDWILHQWQNCRDPQQRGLLQAYLFGGHIDQNDHHGALFTKDILTQYMQESGLVQICEWSPVIQDCASLPVSLNLQGVKPATPEGDMTAEITPIRFPDNWKIRQKPKTVVTLSQPRLGFVQQMMCLHDALHSIKGADIIHHHGFPWEKVLTIGFQKAIEQEADYILTVDYDGLFVPDDLMALMHVMQSHPELCAAYSGQINRHNFEPIVWMKELDYTGAITETPFGHFGLTLIRADMIKMLPHPWFLSLPDPETGEWNQHKTDADIYFWRNINACGGRVAQVNTSVIGHMDLCAIWMAKNGPVFQPISQYAKGGKPDNAIKHMGEWQGIGNKHVVRGRRGAVDNGDNV